MPNVSPPIASHPTEQKHNCQVGCKLTLRWRLRGFSCTPSSRGEHPATNDPVQDEAKARHADRVKHLPPLRALAQLLSEHVPEEAGTIRFIRSGLPDSEIPNQKKPWPCCQEMPDEAQLAKAHRRCIKGTGSKRKIDSTSGDLQAWLDFLAVQFSLREAKSGHQLKYWAAELRDDDGFLPLSGLLQPAPADEKVTPGTAVMRSDKMMEMAALVLRTCPPVLLCDVTYKISNSGWGLALFALASQHLDAHTAWPASQAIIIAAAWVPKESYTSWLAALATMYRIYLPLRLHERVRVVMFDGTTGGEKAVKCLLPDALLARDVRHVQASLSHVFGMVTHGRREHHRTDCASRT